MMDTFVAASHPYSKQASLRLSAACALSLLLHLALLLGIPVNPAGGVPRVVSTIAARLEPAAPEPAAEKTTGPTLDYSRPRPAEAKAGTKRESKPAVLPSPDGGIDVPWFRDPTYYLARQLDVYPRPLTPIKLNYPAAAARERADGQLLVLLLIDELGIVNEASIVEARPEGHFEESTLAVFRAVRFSPAQKQGHPVKSRVLMQVNYVYGDNQGTVR